jgi:hypothetical protein
MSPAHFAIQPFFSLKKGSSCNIKRSLDICVTLMVAISIGTTKGRTIASAVLGMLGKNVFSKAP